MSLSNLNERILRCSREMDQQRHRAQRLVSLQKKTIQQKARDIPLPLAIGVGFFCGFLAQRLIPTPRPTRLLHLMSTTWKLF
jgi:hypothetical protein